MADRPDTDAIRQALRGAFSLLPPSAIAEGHEAEAMAALDRLAARLSEYEQALREIDGLVFARGKDAFTRGVEIRAIIRAALSGSAGPDKPKADTGDAASGARVEDGDLSGNSA